MPGRRRVPAVSVAAGRSGQRGSEDGARPDAAIRQPGAALRRDAARRPRSQLQGQARAGRLVALAGLGRPHRGRRRIGHRRAALPGGRGHLAVDKQDHGDRRTSRSPTSTSSNTTPRTSPETSEPAAAIHRAARPRRAACARARVQRAARRGGPRFNSFHIEWPAVTDLSGIGGAYVKFDAPPTNAADGVFYAGSTEINGVQAPGEGRHSVYVWLRDGAGNADIKTAVAHKRQRVVRWDSARHRHHAHCRFRVERLVCGTGDFRHVCR